jgi:hypothetical protein
VRSGSHRQVYRAWGGGGGRRCTHPDYKKSAVAPSDKCKGHGGGGRRCTHKGGCNRSAVGPFYGPSGKCKGHGGGGTAAIMRTARSQLLAPRLSAPPMPSAAATLTARRSWRHWHTVTAGSASLQGAPEEVRPRPQCICISACMSSAFAARLEHLPLSFQLPPLIFVDGASKDHQAITAMDFAFCGPSQRATTNS